MARQRERFERLFNRGLQRQNRRLREILEWQEREIETLRRREAAAEMNREMLVGIHDKLAAISQWTSLIPALREVSGSIVHVAETLYAEKPLSSPPPQARPKQPKAGGARAFPQPPSGAQSGSFAPPAVETSPVAAPGGAGMSAVLEEALRRVRMGVPGNALATKPEDPPTTALGHSPRSSSVPTPDSASRPFSSPSPDASASLGEQGSSGAQEAAGAETWDPASAAEQRSCSPNSRPFRAPFSTFSRSQETQRAVDAILSSGAFSSGLAPSEAFSPEPPLADVSASRGPHPQIPTQGHSFAGGRATLQTQRGARTLPEFVGGLIPGAGWPDRPGERK